MWLGVKEYCDPSANRERSVSSSSATVARGIFLGSIDPAKGGQYFASKRLGPFSLPIDVMSRLRRRKPSDTRKGTCLEWKEIRSVVVPS
jgi:hypothetical protein